MVPGIYPPIKSGDALEIYVSTGDGTAVATGSYDLVFPTGLPGGTRGAQLLRIELDAGTTIGAGSSGSVVLTSAGGNFAGSFSTVLEDFDGGTIGTLSGSFSASTSGVVYVF
jgi:hypothetical protein